MLFEKVPAKLLHAVHESFDDSYPEDPEHRQDHTDAGAHSDEPDRIPRVLIVERYHIVCFTISILSYVFDIGSDVFVGVNHFRAGREVAALFTTVFAIVPSIVLNIVSFAWSCDDRSQRRNGISIEEEAKNRRTLTIPAWLLTIICVFQLGPVWWHYKALYYGLKFRAAEDEKSKRFFFCRMIEAERDATLLRLFEGLLESAPQMVVQSTVLSQHLWLRQYTRGGVNWGNLPFWVYTQTASICISLFSMCWSITSQHRTIRMARPDKVNVHPHETILQLIWRAATVLSRIVVVVLCILVFGYYTIIFALVHYLISLFHIAALQSVETGTGSNALEIGVLLINAFVHSFAPFNTAEGNTRYRYLAAYSVEVLEAAIVFGFVFFSAHFSFPWRYHLMILATSAFALGISTMGLYYSCFHPNRRRHKRITTTDGEQEIE